MGIIDEKLLLCHGIPEESVDKKISTVKYNNRTVYEWFNHPFTADFGSPYLNLPPITIDDIPLTDKRYRYTPDLLPADISVDFENSGSNLITTSDSPLLLLLTYDNPNSPHATKKYEPYRGRVKIGNCCRKHDDITF